MRLARHGQLPERGAGRPVGAILAIAVIGALLRAYARGAFDDSDAEPTPVVDPVIIVDEAHDAVPVEDGFETQGNANDMGTVQQADLLGCPVLLALQDEMESTGESETNPDVWNELLARIDLKSC